MKWVKANERLPKKVGEYICKHYYKEVPEVLSGVCTLEFKDGAFWLQDDIFHHLYWLDESPESPTPAGDKTMETIMISNGLELLHNGCAYVDRDRVEKSMFQYAAQKCAPLQARIAELERNLKAATALLEELGDYMDKMADTVDGESPRPNTEMCFAQEIDNLLGKIKGSN